MNLLLLVLSSRKLAKTCEITRLPSHMLSNTAKMDSSDRRMLVPVPACCTTPHCTRIMTQNKRVGKFGFRSQPPSASQHMPQNPAQQHPPTLLAHQHTKTRSSFWRAPVASSQLQPPKRLSVGIRLLSSILSLLRTKPTWSSRRTTSGAEPWLP